MFRDYLNAMHKSLDPFIDASSLRGTKTGGDAVLEASEYREDAALQGLLSMTANTDFVASFANSLAMIIVTEIGDKTFFIAAVLAMRNGRLVVYLGAMCKCALPVTSHPCLPPVTHSVQTPSLYPDC